MALLSNDFALISMKINNECSSFSRIHNHTTSTSQNLNEFPLTVLCEDKSGQMIPYKLVLKSNTTINEVCSLFAQFPITRD